MKFILVPLLIVGMFASFATALLAMLFFTETVQDVEDVKALWVGRDSTRLAGEFVPRGFSVDSVLKVGEDYKNGYEELVVRLQAKEDSLVVWAKDLILLKDSLDKVQQTLFVQADSAFRVKREENLQELTKLMNAVKPNAAAAILDTRELSDTTKALLLKRIDTSRAGKIMAALDAGKAAKLANLMQEL